MDDVESVKVSDPTDYLFLETTNNVLKATQKTNDSVRQNRDWENMKGRAVS